MEFKINIGQSVAVLVDGNNIERSLSTVTNQEGAMLNFDIVIPRLLANRSLNRLLYFREGKRISSKLAERLHTQFYGSVIPCHKSADIPLSIKATQLASKVDTVIIMSGDSDYIELVKHLQAEGVRVEIAAVAETTAEILREGCDYYHPLTENDWFVFNHPKTSKSHFKKSTTSDQQDEIKKSKASEKKRTNKKINSVKNDN